MYKLFVHDSMFYPQIIFDRVGSVNSAPSNYPVYHLYHQQIPNLVDYEKKLTPASCIKDRYVIHDSRDLILPELKKEPKTKNQQKNQQVSISPQKKQHKNWQMQFQRVKT